MKHKPIKLDWGELEVAFNNQNDELVYCLDLVTGYVSLEDEGDDDYDDIDDEHFDPRSAVSKRSDDSELRPRIQPLKVETKIGWMEAFVVDARAFEEVGDEVCDALKEALAADDAPAELSRVLNANPESRDRWYLYRAERVREMIDAWLAEQGVTPAEPPPWSR